MKIFKIIVFILIIFNIFLASRWAIDGNLFFHTDIARDFLLIEDIVSNKHLTLIGPRSGAIPGVFHGPLWLYLNVPAFVLGNGNPAIVAWFWVVLYLFSLVFIYYAGKKIFDEKTGLLSALMLSSATVLQVRSAFNPYGAMLLLPLYLYAFSVYLKNKNVKVLILSFFILGLIIQFQMAFGIPILVITMIYLCWFLLSVHKIRHIFSSLVLAIPLSTFFLFDIRNNFLQVRSVINYLTGVENHGKIDLNFSQLASLRFQESILAGLGEITLHQNILTIFLVLFLLITLLILIKNKQLLIIHKLFIFFYGGFWLLTFLFKGPIWNYYYTPFIPMIILVFCSLRKVLDQKVFYFIFALIFIFNFQSNFKDIISYNPNAKDQDTSTWKFNYLVAEKSFSGREKEFGFYIFTPDLYGYSPRYAMNYYQKITKDKKSYPFDKKQITYLLIAPPPEYGKDPNSIWYQKNINSDTWKNNDVRINKNADEVTSFSNGFKLEKYILSDTLVKVQSNQFLIQSIFFR
ncbi:MAG: glycosyltransferase family 39 protein [Candidatus Daviesbacteria bacterium]|nr:glycosyltransferase family 39 protein [Candidatus Daviesbacteria bacterium]